MFLMFSYPTYKSEEVEYLKRYLHQYMWENSAVYLTVLDFMGLPNKVTMKGFFFFYLGEAVTWQVIIKLLPGLRKQMCWASGFMVMNILISRKQYNWFTNILQLNSLKLLKRLMLSENDKTIWTSRTIIGFKEMKVFIGKLRIGSVALKGETKPLLPLRWREPLSALK